MSLTILIPTFNRPRELSRLLDSFSTLKPNMVSIIIGDNSNNNETKNVVKEYKEKLNCNIDYYHHKNNLGFDGNIFFLASKPKSSYAWFVGDDDIFVNGAIDIILENLLLYKPDIGFVDFTFNQNLIVNCNNVSIKTISLKKYIEINGPKFIFLSMNIINTKLCLDNLNKINKEDPDHKEIAHAAILFKCKPSSKVLVFNKKLIVNAGAQRHYQEKSINSDIFIIYTRIILSLVKLWKKSLHCKNLLASFRYYVYVYFHSFRRVYAISRVYKITFKEIFFTFKLDPSIFIPTLFVSLFPKTLIKLSYIIYVRFNLKKLFWNLN